VTLLLAERDRPRSDTLDVPLPDHLSVSALVTLRRDPTDLARRIRRPMPARPAPLARRGTAFHAWLEQRFGGERLLDLDELPGAADDTAVADAILPRCSRRSSQPVGRSPPGRGRSAVRGRGSVRRWFAAGWMPCSRRRRRLHGRRLEDRHRAAGEAMRAAAVQLAAYRIAWAELAGVPTDRVRAAFHYVRSGSTVAPADLLDSDGLTGLVGALPDR